MEKPKKVSVIIPALNEERTIRKVIEALKTSIYVDEIIVVDNNSTDGTSKIAKASGAKILFCKERGFGNALKMGFQKACNNWLFKIDADIKNPNSDWVELMIAEISSNVALVKGYWKNKEDPMPVTNLVAKPALKKLYPELAEIKMPISGIYLCNRDCFDLGKMKNDFAFDIQLVVESHRAGFLIKQKFLGEVYDNLKPISNYPGMSFDILSYLMDFHKETRDATLMVLMAHPDDFIIWCGGTIINHLINGNKVYVIIATSDKESMTELASIKKMFPNLKIILLHFLEFQEFTNPQSVSKVEKLISKFKPNIFITHHRDDPHKDHRSCFDLTMAAMIRAHREVLPSRILMSNCYFQRLVSKNGFNPDLYIDISEAFGLKGSLMEKFVSQDVQFWKELFTKTDEFNGFKCGIRAAEAFETINFYTTPEATKLF